MTSAQIETRQERAQNGVLVASKMDDGFRVHSTANPSQLYFVRWNGDRLTCTCPDFEFHAADAGWRCKHILAVEPLDDNLAELPEPPEEQSHEPAVASADAPAGAPPNGASPRRRRSAKDPVAPIYMIIKRSISPDGRIDSVSVEFSMPVVDLQVGEIKDRALRTLQLQRDIVSSFLRLNAGGSPETHAPGPKPHPVPVEPNGEGSPVFAKMLDIGKVNGKWGDRLCIVFDLNGNRTRLFGSPKQLAAHIEAAGYRVLPENITAGLRLNIPCQVTTTRSGDGRYVNVEHIFSVRSQTGNGGTNGARVH